MKKMAIFTTVMLVMLVLFTSCTNPIQSSTAEAEVTQAAAAKTTEEELVEQYQSNEWDGGTTRVYTYSEPNNTESDLVCNEYVVTDGMLYKDGTSTGIVPDVGYEPEVEGELVGVAPANQSAVIDAGGTIYFFSKGTQVDVIYLDANTNEYSVYLDESVLVVKTGTHITGYDYMHENRVVITRDDVNSVINTVGGLIINTLDHINFSLNVDSNGASFSFGNNASTTETETETTTSAESIADTVE